MKEIKYETLLGELRELLENIKNSKDKDEEALHKAIAVIKCRQVIDDVRNNRIEIRKMK